VTDGFLAALLKGLAATSPLEAVSVVFGFAYTVLAMKRTRWCWVAALLSSAPLVYLAWVSRLPMQAALQLYYVGMAVYGFWHWSRDEGKATRAVSTWPVLNHVIAWAAILLVSLLWSRFYLAGQTRAAWPLLDSLTTFGSLVATWLMAQVKLENWFYWIVLDAISVFLFATQGLMLVALLFAAYLVLSAIGFFTWLKTWRSPVQQT
jgi:nicotinamide mononucleotide transporter